mgnify:CR=1 FL=1
MPNQFVEHKDRWLLLSEHSDFEYALLFIRTWIPFNAWYCNNYPDLRNNDSRILKVVKADNNLFRTRIISLLQGSDGEARHFREIVADLHACLEKYYIPDHNERVTFSKLYFRDNPRRVSSYIKRKINYKAELIVNSSNETTSVRLVLIDSATGNNKLNYTYHKYSMEHLMQDIDFKKLKHEQFTTAKKCFADIDPKRQESLLSSTTSFLRIGDHKFIDDANLLSQSLIQVLYRLRCILFHGEIQPSKDNLGVYEPAYHLMRILIKSLK